MAGGVESVAAEIDRRLAAALPPGSPNAFTAADLREWAAEYLGRHDDEVARVPDLAGCPHWNLWMMDARREDALFAVLAFRPDGIDILCGSGNSFEIQRISEYESPDDPTAAIAAFQGQCATPDGVLRLDRRAAEAWLGRPRTV